MGRASSIMKILCNGAERDIRDGMTVMDLIRELDLNPETVVVEYNNRILPRNEYDELLIEDGATLELVRFVGGG